MTELEAIPLQYCFVSSECHCEFSFACILCAIILKCVLYMTFPITQLQGYEAKTVCLCVSMYFECMISHMQRY